MGRRVEQVERRGKVLILRFDVGSLLVHLGMSGHLRLCQGAPPTEKHDHLEILFPGPWRLRLHDPRRFGGVLWTAGDPLEHPLVAGLGPEPLEDGLTGAYLFNASRGRRVAIKSFLMNGRVVAGIGNIYANEALFRARLNPLQPAGGIARKGFDRLVTGIQGVLQAALRHGGTTLRDYCDGEGRPGHFQLELNVYGRSGKPCLACGRLVRHARQGQRSTFWCAHCQP
jgi:formamidopyrimidine-DNA glycosylase